MENDWFQGPFWPVVGLAAGYYIYETIASWRLARTPFPLVGSFSALVPQFALNLIFAWKAAAIIEHGYTKFKHQAFQLIRGDGNVIVLPIETLTELSSLSSSIASPHGALEHDLLGRYTGIDLILMSRLHHTVVQRKLTPRLTLLTPILEQELVSALEDNLPVCNRWTEIQPYHMLAQCSARLSAKALVGKRLSRSQEWLDISINYTENLFRTIVIMRLFPTWMHPLLCILLPPYWKCNSYIRSAQTLLAPEIKEAIAREDSGLGNQDEEDNASVLTWLTEVAKGSDRDVNVLAQVEVLLALASVHTTLLRMVNVLYDLVQHPHYFDELRAEIQRLQYNIWGPDCYKELTKLDSVLRESQRLSPPTTIGMKRLFRESYTFSNGIYIPKNTYVCLPTFAIENDPEHTVNPDTFDGLRNYRLRKNEDDEGKNQFSSPERTVLNFGYGKSACPGRFFADRVLKIVFVKLIIEYDFSFPNGSTRPKNLQVHEFLFPRPWDKILIRRREGETGPF